MSGLYKSAAIVGVGEPVEIGFVPKKSQLQLMAEASLAALEDAGLTMEDVDGVYSQSGPAPKLAEYLGLRPNGVDSTSIGGASNSAQVLHAAAAISAGLVHTVLIAHCGKARSGRDEGKQPGGAPSQWEAPFGVAGPVSSYALAARRHMYQYGTTSEQLAAVSVSTRKWATLNPRATMRDPITVEDVVNSRIICDPLHLLDCCLVTDAAAALVVTSAERARDLRQRPVWILGGGECHTHTLLTELPDITVSGAVESSGMAYGMAGVTAKDVDVAEVYDAFTSSVVQLLEDLGFCKKGEGGPFVEGGRTAPGGQLPMNTQGGALSFQHPGMFGIWTMLEAVRQLRHEYQGTPRQVSGAQVALTHANGGVFEHQVTIILGRG